MKTRNVPQSGACGDVVASHNRYGQYLRKRPSGKKRRNKPHTADTDRAEANWRALSALWNTLSEEQYRAWDIAADQERSRPRNGQGGRLTGRAFFFKINSARASLGLEPLTRPPAHVGYYPNPVQRLIVTNRGGRIALKLELSGIPPELIKVYGAPPQPRGKRRCWDLRVLGRLPAPDGGVSEITELYVKKYGAPRIGNRVFIRTVVHVNGQQVDPQVTNCVVPERELPAHRRREPPAPAAIPGV